MKPQVDSSRPARARVGGTQAPYWTGAVLALLLAAAAILGVDRAANSLAGNRRADAAATDLLSVVATTHAAGIATNGPTPGSELTAASLLIALDPAVTSFERVAGDDAWGVRAAFDKLKHDVGFAEQQILSGQDDPAAIDQAIGASNLTLIDALATAKAVLHERASGGASLLSVVIVGAFALAGLLTASLLVLLARIRTATMRHRQEQQARYRSLMQFSGDVVAVLDRDGTVLEQSASMLRLLGRTDRSLIGRPFADIVQEGERAAVTELVRAAATPGSEPARAHLQLSHVDGSWRPFDVIAALMDPRSATSRLLLTCRPAAVQIAAPPQPAALAVRHPISGLLSETIFRDRLQHALGRALRNADPVSLVLLDFASDAAIAALSDEARQAVMRTVSGRLLRSIRAGDSIGHIGELELGVILEAADRATAVGLARRMVDQLQQPVAHVNGQLAPAPRVGIATKQDPRDNVDTLVLDAHASLARGFAPDEPDTESETIAAGSDISPTAEPTADTLAASRPDIAVASAPAPAASASPVQRRRSRRAAASAPAKPAFDRSSVDLHYLPALALETGEIVEMETLVRWRHPQRGWIALASSGMAAAVLPWLLDHVCTLAVGLPPTRNGRRVRLSVNLTPDTTIDEALVDLVATTLLRTGIEPSNLQLEVPVRLVDSAAPSFSTAVESLRQIRELGVRLAIDDAGAEADRLPDFAVLPVHGVKVDRSVIAMLDRSAERRSVVRALVERAQAHGVTVCGTGIDSLEQAEKLWELGVDEGQGPLFFRPVSASQFQALFPFEPASVAAD